MDGQDTNASINVANWNCNILPFVTILAASRRHDGLEEISIKLAGSRTKFTERKLLYNYYAYRFLILILLAHNQYCNSHAMCFTHRFMSGLEFLLKGRRTSVFLRATWIASAIKTSFLVSCCRLSRTNIPHDTDLCRTTIPNTQADRQWSGLRQMRSIGGVHLLNHRWVQLGNLQ